MGATILLIEDNPVVARLVCRQLELGGHAAIAATDGLQGLQVAQDTPPDLILLDLMLPGMDGLEVLAQLRATPATARIPVIISSAKSNPDDQQKALQSGAAAFLAKPFNLQDLLEAVRSLLPPGI